MEAAWKSPWSTISICSRTALAFDSNSSWQAGGSLRIAKTLMSTPSTPGRSLGYSRRTLYITTRNTSPVYIFSSSHLLVMTHFFSLAINTLVRLGKGFLFSKRDSKSESKRDSHFKVFNFELADNKVFFLFSANYCFSATFQNTNNSQYAIRPAVRTICTLFADCRTPCQSN